MDYSGEIKQAFKKHGIEIGNRVSLEKDGKEYEGMLMPNTGSPSSIVIKLDNGYNIGILFPAKIKKIGHEKPKALTTREKKKITADRSKPTISIITTGGTITSKIDYATGGATSLMTPEEFMEKNPEIRDTVSVRINEPFSKMTEDMGPDDFAVIASEVAKELNKGSEGAIVTLGTDILHYVSAALSFMLRSPKPVVLVGSQRSSDRGGTDSYMNLLCASHVALGDIAETGVCMHATINDDYCYFIRGTKVRKMHASRRDAFRPVNDMPLAKVFPTGHLEIMNSVYKKRGSGKTVADTKYEPKVALQKVYPGSDPEILDHLASRYRGVVLEATGFGHVPTNKAKKSWIPFIKRTSEEIPVVISTQTIYGRVNPNVYTNLRLLFQGTNAIPAEDMHPETAFVKLGFVLGHTRNIEEARKMMLENLAGEITPRDLDDFLI